MSGWIAKAAVELAFETIFGKKDKKKLDMKKEELKEEKEEGAEEARSRRHPSSYCMT
jgi:hypothetical protein